MLNYSGLEITVKESCPRKICNLSGGFKHLFFSPLPGEAIQFDEHSFQMGLKRTLTRKQPNVLNIN